MCYKLVWLHAVSCCVHSQQLLALQVCVMMYFCYLCMMLRSVVIANLPQLLHKAYHDLGRTGIQ